MDFNCSIYRAQQSYTVLLGLPYHILHLGKNTSRIFKLSFSESSSYYFMLLAAARYRYSSYIRLIFFTILTITSFKIKKNKKNIYYNLLSHKHNTEHSKHSDEIVDIKPPFLTLLHR
jgi:hypothetical protein